MIRLVRITGFLFMLVGVLVILTWLIEPLRDALREILPRLRELPLPIQIGGVMVIAGLLILLSSLLVERYGERDEDRKLLDEN